MNDEEIVLSHKDTESFDEITLDKLAAQQVFGTASRRYHNQLVSLLKSEKELWDHLKEVYNLDPDKIYVSEFSRKRRRQVIKEKREETGD